MDAATERPLARETSPFLAGLQAGMVGVLWMLLWLGISAAWQQRSFWTSENLFASVFYGSAAIRRGFAGRTLSGLALYLLIYSSLGALLATAVGYKLPRLRVLLITLVFALAWYYLSFHILWKAVSPLVTLLHVERANLIGHLVYGLFLSRYPAYAGRQPIPAAQAESA